MGGRMQLKRVSTTVWSGPDQLQLPLAGAVGTSSSHERVTHDDLLDMTI